ncbi:MAG: KH domain-containing protein [Fimbriimonadia bacterium]|nr:KH domain-containing protein [Fimbriimonadia bacterium]
MKIFIETLVKALVENPDSVQISEEVDRDTAFYKITVHPNDRGKVIGKGGRIANALRAVTRAVASKNRLRIQIDIQTD